MNTEQEIKSIQVRIELTDARIEHIYAEINVIKAMIQEASVTLPDGIIGNTSDSPYAQADSNDPNHYLPKVGEVVGVSDFDNKFHTRIFVKHDKDLTRPFVCVNRDHQYRYKSGSPYSTISWKYCRRLNGEIIEFGCDAKQATEHATDTFNYVVNAPTGKSEDYSHLLPEGYEFCAEGEHEKWVKVELHPNLTVQEELGNVAREVVAMKSYYRPIRKTPTASYAVDWTNAPNWADVHAFDGDGSGYWYGTKLRFSDMQWIHTFKRSTFTLPDGLDWKLSKTFRPR